MLTDIKQIWSGGKVQKPLLMLKAGSLSLYYLHGSLRYICDGRSEIIRMIYSAFRDREWLNIKPVIKRESVQRGTDNFRIEYSCIYGSEEPLFQAVYIIEGKTDNTISFSFEGEALKSFEKNRLGFCILHPVKECSGKPCELTHSKGNKEILSFPALISPDQPFLDLKAMKWDTEDSECLLEFSGDIFETEDQRNWTDASFKTYCTPLSQPSPVRIEKGEKISQTVILKVKERNKYVFGPKDEVISISFERQESLAIPLTGTGQSTRINPLTTEEATVLKFLDMDHYRCDIFLFEPDWIEKAQKSLYESNILNCPLELTLFFSENYIEETRNIVNWISEQKPAIRILCLHHKSEYETPHNLAGYSVPLLKTILPDTMIACGTNANFAQLNNERPKIDPSDLITYSIHPQEHASDNLTLIENLEAQKDTVLSARVFSNGKGIMVSPVNLQRRFNANVEYYEKTSDDNAALLKTDSRLMSLFGACWTAGSIKYLAESGVDAITYYETVGERGIIQGSYDSRWPDEFKSRAGMIFPVFHILNWFLNGKSYRIIRSISSSPLKVDVLAMLLDKKIRFVLINYTHHFQNVTITINAGILNSFSLETDSFSAAASDPDWINSCNRKEIQDRNNLALSPYSITFFDGDLDD